MKTIWKYMISTAPKTTLKMPKGATLLAGRSQPGLFHPGGGTIEIWAMVDPEVESANHTVQVVPNNEDQAAIEGRYFGTVIMGTSSVIYHLFDGGEE